MPEDAKDKPLSFIDMMSLFLLRLKLIQLFHYTKGDEKGVRFFVSEKKVKK